MKIIRMFLPLLTLAACAPKGFDKISKSMEDDCTVNKRKNLSFTTSLKIRKKLYKAGRLDFINPINDTIYILKSYDIQTASFSGRIWNSRQALEYSYSLGKFVQESKPRYTQHTILLTEKWDTAAIREEERLHSTSTPVTYIVASRTNITNKIPHTECIIFEEFFLLQRDRFN